MDADLNIEELFGENFQKGEELMWTLSVSTPGFFKQKISEFVLTTHAVAKIINGELKEHAFYHEIYSYDHQYKDKLDRYDLFFYGYTVYADFYQGREYVESVTLFHFENIGSGISDFIKIWELREPIRVMNLEISGICSLYGFDYSSTNDAVLSNQVSGLLDGRKFLMELPETMPLKHVRITINCPNENNHFFFMYPQLDDPGQAEDILIDDPDFDDTFILQASADGVFEYLLTEEIKNQIMDCSSVSKCTFGFGNFDELINRKPQKSDFKLQDQEDILDFQLLENEGTRKPDPTNASVENLGKTNQFIFEAKLDHRMQFNIHSLSKFIEICIECTRNIAKRLEGLQ